MRIIRAGSLFVIVDGQNRFVGVGTCVVVERGLGRGAAVSMLYAGTTGPVRSLNG